MPETNRIEQDFETYVLSCEPQEKEKGKIWQAAIGLQQVDGLTPSEYLYQTAKRNISGKISIKDARALIDSYYEGKQDRDRKEADRVSARIVELLSEKAFSFSPDELLLIHEHLFEEIFTNVRAGHFRAYNITKKEWVLNGDTVLYADYSLISRTLEYEFGRERHYNYSEVSVEDAITHFSRFIANIWQIHPFGEGNTRTIAVFAIMYLQSLGFNVDIEVFGGNGWYFRNALVRANYNNIPKGIGCDLSFLEKFFRNLILGEKNPLKNRYMHV